jgi:hypothetical protein
MLTDRGGKSSPLVVQPHIHSAAQRRMRRFRSAGAGHHFKQATKLHQTKPNDTNEIGVIELGQVPILAGLKFVQSQALEERSV